jgi:lipopolysaccharide/colanic/teichoic acid biosynthesis glycosyltransferase
MFIGPLISLAILLESGRPIVYEQTRAGKGGIPFRILKFRTMQQDAESDGSPQLTTKNDERITTLGRFLRKTHLDEWLQFINVLRGEMSLVGPRPERPELVNRFQEKIPFYRARLLVKPGIAGWAQVNVSYFATIEEMVVKLEYDLYYIKHRNILMDIVILLRTFAAIIGFRGR